MIDLDNVETIKTQEQRDSHNALLAARDEIAAVLKKYDVAGVIALHRPGLIELLSCLEPSYSMMHVKAGGEVHFFSKLEHYNGDRQRQMYEIAGTSNMLSTFGEMLGRHALELMDLHRHLDKICPSENGPIRRIKPN